MSKKDHEEGYLKNKMRECLEKIDGLEQRIKVVELKNQRYEQHSPSELNERINKISKQIEETNIENIKKINKEMADKEFKRNLQKVIKLNSELGDQLSDLVIGIFKEQREDILYNVAAIRVLISLFADGDLLKIDEIKITEKEFNEMVEICKNTKETRDSVCTTTIRKTHIDPEEFIKVIKERQDENKNGGI